MNENPNDYTDQFHAEIHLPAETSSVAKGRTFVRETLAGWGLGAVRESVVLAASELLTNAVLHACSAPTLQIFRTDAGLRIEITDKSARRPHLRNYGPSATTGRGILLVESISSRWGIDAGATGKIVWCEFDC